MDKSFEFEVRGKMPELIAEMKSDMVKPELSLKRDFFIMNKEFNLRVAPNTLVYFNNDHTDLSADRRL